MLASRRDQAPVNADQIAADDSRRRRAVIDDDRSRVQVVVYADRAAVARSVAIEKRAHRRCDHDFSAAGQQGHAAILRS